MGECKVMNENPLARGLEAAMPFKGRTMGAGGPASAKMEAPPPTPAPEPFWESSPLSQGSWCHLVAGGGTRAPSRGRVGLWGVMDTREGRSGQAQVSTCLAGHFLGQHTPKRPPRPRHGSPPGRTEPGGATSRAPCASSGVPSQAHQPQLRCLHFH